MIMNEIIDLSQELFIGMPVFDGMPQFSMTVHTTHEQDATKDSDNISSGVPSAHRLELGEHTGTHVDALSHMGKEYRLLTIDTMPLSMFYTEGFCLDFSHKGLRELITAGELEAACIKENYSIKKGDTILLYTDHYRRYFGTSNWQDGPGLTAEATQWLGNHQIAAFGVETMSPGVRKVSNKDVHKVCGEMGFTHYENLINLHLLLGKGRFRFIALPLKIRGGTGSPVRAIAVFE